MNKKCRNRRESSDAYLIHICSLPHSVEKQYKTEKTSFQPALCLSSAVEWDCKYS